MARERTVGLPDRAQDYPAAGSMFARVAALAARQPGPRPWLVFVVCAAIESACMVAIGAVDQTRHVLGLPGSIMALMAVIAGALGGPVVGVAAALTGGAVYTATVASFGTRGEWPATIASIALWSAVALVSATLAAALRRQTGRLAAASHYARSLIEASLDPLVTISRGGKVTDVNVATEQVTGVPREQLVGTDFSEYFTEPEEARAGYQRVFDEGFVLDYPLAIRGASGTVTDVLYNATLYRDEAGSVVGVFAAARDVTERKRVEQALRRSQESLQEAQRLALLGNWELDLVENALSWSDEIYRIFEIDKARFRASYQAFLNAIHPDDREAVDAAYTTSVQDRTPYEITHRLLMSDGRIKHVHERGRTYYDEAGAPVRSVGTVQDITERVQSEEQAARLAAIVESSDDAVVGKDLLGTIVSWNSGAERLYGYTEAEALGRPVSMLALGGHQDEVPKILERIRVGERVEHFETTRVAKDGREIDVSLAISPIKSAGGSIIGAASVARDITKQKLAERALRHVEAALMAEKDELARSNAELEQFAYVASHDLQEPLRMVASYTQLLSRRYKGKLDDDADEFIGYAVDGAQRMQQLITDLLAFSRVGTRGKPLVAMESQSACDEALANLAVTIEESGAQVDADPLPAVKGDHQQLVQLFQNLIGNAVKFHGEEPARVHVSALKDGREWVFSVADDGIGMDPQYFERIFVIFQRLQGRQEFPGTGIGLALCKKIVARHHGRIWVESQPGRGSTFYFTIPTQGDAQ